MTGPLELQAIGFSHAVHRKKVRTFLSTVHGSQGPAFAIVVTLEHQNRDIPRLFADLIQAFSPALQSSQRMKKVKKGRVDFLFLPIGTNLPRTFSRSTITVQKLPALLLLFGGSALLVTMLDRLSRYIWLGRVLRLPETYHRRDRDKCQRRH